MSEQFTIKSVGDPREWESPKFKKKYLGYPLDLEDANGHVHIGIESNRQIKDDGSHNEPKAGDEVIGTISNSNFGEKLTLDYDAMKEQGGGGSTSSSGGADYRPQSGGGKSPDTQASIVRQHSQEMALRVLAIRGRMGERDFQDDITYWTDFFVADANKAAAVVGSPTPPAPKEATGPEAGRGPGLPQNSEKQHVHERLYSLLEAAGEPGAIATLLTDWLITEQQVDKQDDVLAALQNEERKDKCVMWARSGYESKHGPLPHVSDSDDDIPF